MRGRAVFLGLILTAMVVAALLGALAWRSRLDRQFELDLAVARKELVDGRHFTALERLQALASQRPESGEVQYLLGINALARGREDQAEAAWGKVRPGDSPHFGYAALHQAELDRKRGRLTRAEERLRAGLADPGSHRPRVRWALAQLLILEGRREEALRLLAEGIPEHPEPVQGLRDLAQIERESFPVESARNELDEAIRREPDDDRARLGRAHLALRAGQFDKAKALLDGCLKRRPDDVPCWELALDWGLETGAADVVALALSHVPISPKRLGRAQEIRAWAAQRLGDHDAEREALEAWSALEPSNPVPLERLAALAVKRGEPEKAAAYRDRRADLNVAIEAYLQSLVNADATSDPLGMLQRLEKLGWRTDLAYWSRLANRPPPPEPSLPPGETLAQAYPELLPLLGAVRPPDSPTATPTAGPRFAEITSSSGVDFVHRTGAGTLRPIPPVTMGGGVATLDYDGDGWLDLYLVQSGTFPPDRETATMGDRLHRNRGDGTFEDVTNTSGLSQFRGGYGHGVAVGDVDGDGHPDLFVTRWRAYALYRNRGDGTFEDVTERWGLAGDRDWPTSAAFADLDQDGDLDLYVCHYLQWDEADPRNCLDPADPSKYACSPRSFPALPDHLFRNDGGRFTDVTEASGIVDRDGRGLGVVASDLNGDGLVDLFVANDLSADNLWINRGNLTFEDRGLEAGVSGNESGGHQAGMGIACGDVDGDGLPDLAVTNFLGESTSLFRNLGGGSFADQSGPSGIRSASRFLLGFGASFLDADADGRLDLLTANGHVHDGRPNYPWKMPAQLLAGRPGARFEDVSPRAGDPFQVLHLGRGLATGDLDNDGRVDAVLVSLDEPVVLLRNVTESPGHFVTLSLEGTASNRDAVGAVVRADLGGGEVITGFRNGGGSYQSSCDPRIHLGLGQASRVDALEVRWPSGNVQRFGPLESGRGYRIREGDGEPTPLPGWETR
ncbi:MAG: FG-GAP-like repeat-containing protein [Isosphaeraceae bacterium]